MTYSNYLMKIDRLVELLKQENTGCADCLASKLMVSRRTIFRYFDELRLQGAVICYSKSKETYSLEINFRFTVENLYSFLRWHSGGIIFSCSGIVSKRQN